MGTQRALGHLDTQRVLGQLRHSGTLALRALRHLATQSLRTLRALRNLNTRALKALRHSATWGLEALYLADSNRVWLSLILYSI